MITTFEQPKHLNDIIYRRTIRAIWPFFLILGGLLSGVVLLKLWLRASAGESVSMGRWIAAAGVGFVSPIGVLFLLRYQRSQRRYMEFRGDKIFLAERGNIARPRFISWSLTPDKLEPHHTCLQLVYKFGLGRKRWTMLLEDAAQISELKQVLTLQILQPQRHGDAEFRQT